MVTVCKCGEVYGVVNVVYANRGRGSSKFFVQEVWPPSCGGSGVPTPLPDREPEAESHFHDVALPLDQHVQ